MRKACTAPAVVFLLLATAIARATVCIHWFWDNNAAQGVYRSDGETLLPANSIIQLIYTPDGSNTGYNPFDPLSPNEGNILLATMGSTGPGYWLAGPQTFGNVGQYVGGYVFQRVFDTLVGNSPTSGSSFADGLLSDRLSDASRIPRLPPNVSYFFASFEVDPFILGTPFVLSDRLVVIPEPSTWLLLGVGAIVICRRFGRRVAGKGRVL